LLGDWDRLRLREAVEALAEVRERIPKVQPDSAGLASGFRQF
jgi:hypothetical protein